MRFGNPHLLFLLLLVPLLFLIYLKAGRKKRRAIETFYSPSFLKRHPLVLEGRLERVKFVLLLISIALLILALAEPKFGTSKKGSLTREGEVIFAIDTSLSMRAQDIKPDRFRRAIDEVVKTLGGLEGERAGLVIFASAATVISPPTFDYEALKTILSTLDPSTFLDTGTSFERAIEASLSLFKEDRGGKFIVLLSDGEGDPIPPLLLKRLVEKGVKVYTIGIGREIGAPIPVVMKRGVLSYKRDYQGRVVISRLKESVLRSLSSATKGQYFKALENKWAATSLLSYLKKEGKPASEEGLITVYTDRSPLFILAALIFLFISLFIPKQRAALY